MNITKFNNNKANRGFTLSELAVVIVVIAILSTLVVSLYIGVQTNARASIAKDDLVKARDQLTLYYLDNRAYPLTANLADAEVASSNGATLNYTSNGTNYCITATNSTVSYHIDSATGKTPNEGACTVSY